MIQPGRVLNTLLALLLPLGFVVALTAEPKTYVARPVSVDSRVVAPQPAPVTEAATPFPGKWIALTFDDGPDPRFTPAVLALLQRHDAVATFCLVGSEIAGNEALVHRIADAGMRLCDHTRTHDVQLPTRTLEIITDEIVGTQQLIEEAAGGPVSYYRAPGGHWSPMVQEVAAAHGMQPLGWSLDPRDWTRPGAAAIVAQVKREVRPGSVILLHDGGGPQQETIQALAELLPWLAEQGYRFGFPAADSRADPPAAPAAAVAG